MPTTTGNTDCRPRLYKTAPKAPVLDERRRWADVGAKSGMDRLSNGRECVVLLVISNEVPGIGGVNDGAVAGTTGPAIIAQNTMALAARVQLTAAA